MIHQLVNETQGLLSQIDRYNTIVTANSFSDQALREMRDNVKSMADQVKAKMDQIKVDADGWVT
ncbi:hypothetical protein ES703_35411 [subsurface metagenome]